MALRVRYAILALSSLLGCSSSSTDSAKAPAPAESTAKKDSPCDRAGAMRARLPALAKEGRLDRSVRVAQRADELCPSSARESFAARLGALVELGRDAEARELATAIVADREAPLEAQELASRVVDPSRVPASAKSAADLYDAGVAARAKGDRAEMQRSFDRAIVAAERGTGERLWLEPPFADEHQVPRSRLSADGRFLASPVGHGVSIRDAQKGRREVLRLEGPTGDVTDLVYLPGAKIAATAKDFSVWIWDAESARPLAHFHHRVEPTGAEHPLPEELDSIAASPDGTLLVTATSTGATGGSLRLWDVASGQELRKLEGMRDGTSPIVFSPDGATIFSQSDSEGIKRWETRTGRLLPRKDVTLPDGPPSPGLDAWKTRRPRADASPRTIVAVSPDGKKFASGSQDHSVRLWSVGKRAEMHVLGTHRATVTGLAFSPDARWLASCGSDGVFVWGALSNQRARTLDVPSGCGALAFSPDGKRLAAASGSGIRILDFESGHEVTQLAVPADTSVHSVAYSADGLTIAASGGSHVREWDASTWALIRELPPGDFAFASHGRGLVIATSKSVLMVDGSGTETLRLDKPESGFVPIAISPDGTALAAGGDTGSTWLWHLPNATPLDVPGESASGSVAFLGAGNALLTSDSALRIWTGDGRPVLSIVALSTDEAGYAMLAGSTHYVELMGLNPDAASDAFVCRIGSLSFPFDLCRERFEVHGMLATALAGEAVVADP